MPTDNRDKSKVGLSLRQQKKVATQQRILSAVREMTQVGETVSIATAAKRAGVSVATAYRYYSDLDTLRSDAALDLKMSDGNGGFLEEFAARTKGVTDPVERLFIAQAQMSGFVRDNLADYRMFIAKAHEKIVGKGPGDSTAKGGRRILMINQAVQPLADSWTQAELADLLHALMLIMGPEPYFTLHDFAGLPDAEIEQVNKDAIRCIFEAHHARHLRARAQNDPG